MKAKATRRRAALTMISAVALSAPAMAQGTGADLLQLDNGSLDRELRSRYDASLAATLDQATVNANDPRFIWASEAKVQCGIAIGFRKSSTRDETSIRKCGDAYAQFMGAPRGPASIPVPVSTSAVPDEICNQKLAGIVFFEFDSFISPADADQVIDFIANNAAPCNWTSFSVAGHADRSGGDSYNAALSVRRADTVAALMRSRGIDSAVIAVSSFGESQPRVPTPDGERNPQNRRVEITVN